MNSVWTRDPCLISHCLLRLLGFCLAAISNSESVSMWTLHLRSVTSFMSRFWFTGSNYCASQCIFEMKLWMIITHVLGVLVAIFWSITPCYIYSPVAEWILLLLLSILHIRCICSVFSQLRILLNCLRARSKSAIQNSIFRSRFATGSTRTQFCYQK